MILKNISMTFPMAKHQFLFLNNDTIDLITIHICLGYTLKSIVKQQIQFTVAAESESIFAL